MLTALQIRNFAIIDEQTVSFGPGLNVISGETGSGKSILLNALEIILGGRPRTTSIRESAEQLEVEAHFDLSVLPPAVRQSLPDIVQGAELILSRSLNRQGKGKVYVNGRLGTAALLEEIAGKLINICRQGQQLSLLDPRFHRELVDDYGGHAGLLEEYSLTFGRLKEIERLLADSAARRAELSGRQSQLEETVRELGAVNIYPGARASLEARVKRHESSEKIVMGAQAVLSFLSDEEGLSGQFGKVSAKLSEIARLDPKLRELTAPLERSRAELDEFEAALDGYLRAIEIDGAALESLRDELAEIARLERKYRRDDEGLVALLKEAQDGLANIGEGADAGKLEREAASLAPLAIELAQKLSAAREKAGKKLAAQVEAELKELNMPDARFKLQISPAAPAAHGTDALEFSIATNRGEQFKPLKQVASGGELSRIMLVLKKTLRDRSHVNVLVFDEVDTGVSGKVARAMGEKLRHLARASQVVCITHLAQIASLADHHLLVDKKVGKRTISVVREIEGEEKVEEIARMLAGYKVTTAARESARELLASKAE